MIYNHDAKWERICFKLSNKTPWAQHNTTRASSTWEQFLGWGCGQKEKISPLFQEGMLLVVWQEEEKKTSPQSSHQSHCLFNTLYKNFFLGGGGSWCAWASIRGIGDTPPHILGTYQMSPPPPMIFGLYNYSLKWGPFYSCELSTGAVWTFFFFFFPLSERLVMHDGYPYSVSGKLTQKFWGQKKKVSESPLPAHQLFFWLARISRLAADRKQYRVSSPMVWFGLTPMKMSTPWKFSLRSKGLFFLGGGGGGLKFITTKNNTNKYVNL